MGDERIAVHELNHSRKLNSLTAQDQNGLIYGLAEGIECCLGKSGTTNFFPKGPAGEGLLKQSYFYLRICKWQDQLNTHSNVPG